MLWCRRMYKFYFHFFLYFLPRPQEEQVTDDINIDHRVHSRLIGTRGKAISKVMERFRVDIRFPKDKTSGTVVITGLYDDVEDAKEHLITLAEDYVSHFPH